MPVGLRIRNDDGVLQIDESFACLSLITKGVARGGSSPFGHRLRQVDVTYPGDAAVFGLHSAPYGPNAELKLVGQGATVRNTNGTFTTRVYVCWLSTSTPPPETFDVEWFAFGAPRASATRIGLNVRNGAGDLVFSSNAKLMNVVGLAVGSNNNDANVPVATIKPVVCAFVGSVGVNSGVDVTTSMEYIEYYEATFTGFYCYSGGIRIRYQVIFSAAYGSAAPFDPALATGINGPGSYYSRPFVVDGGIL